MIRGRILFVVCLIAGFLNTNAQQNIYEWRIGFTTGYMNYSGDIETDFFPSSFKDPLVGELSFSMEIEKRLSNSFGLQLSFLKGILTANDIKYDKDGNIKIADSNFKRALNFRTEINSSSMRLVYHFDNNQTQSWNAKLSPYLFAGVGIMKFDVFADLRNKSGEYYYYWSDGTIRNLPETHDQASQANIIQQDFIFETKLNNIRTENTSHPDKVIFVPFGLGIKWRISERFNFNLQLESQYVFSDKIDDISGKYPDNYTSFIQQYASNPTGNTATYRGDADRKNDILFYGSAGIHFNFGERTRRFKAIPYYSSRYIFSQPTMNDTTNVDIIETEEKEKVSFLNDSIKNHFDSLRFATDSIQIRLLEENEIFTENITHEVVESKLSEKKVSISRRDSLIVIKFRGMEEGELEFDPRLFIINYGLNDSIIQLRKDLDEIESKIDQQGVIVRSDSLQPETSPTLRDTIHTKSITTPLKDDDTRKRNEQLKEQNEKITKLEKELSELRNAFKSTDNSQPKLSQVQAGTVEDLQQNIKELRAQLNILSKTKPDSIIRDTIKIMQNNDTTLIIKEKPVFITQENKKIKELEANSELLNKKIDSLLTAGTTITGTTQDTSAINELNKEINIIKSQLNELVKKEGDVELKTKPGFDKQNIFFASNKYTVISRYNPVLEQIIQTANEYKE